MADDDHAPPAVSADEALEPVEAGEVEVVGRLVEQEHVEAGQQDRGQRGPGRLAARQRGQVHVEPVDREAEVVAHRAGPGLEVGAAERQVAVEGGGVGVVGARRGLGQRRRRAVQRGLGRRPRRCAGPATRAASPPGRALGSWGR